MPPPRPAHAQTPPACQTNTGVNIDRPRLIAFGRTGIIKVFAATSEAQATATFSITAKDPARPISHPVSVPYSSLATQGGNRRYRFRAEKGDGDALVALTWTKTENGVSCRAQRSETITINKGKRPFISIGHERSPRIIFGHESPDCVARRRRSPGRSRSEDRAGAFASWSRTSAARQSSIAEAQTRISR